VNGQGAPAGGSPEKAAEAGEREESSEGTPNASGKESSPTKVLFSHGVYVQGYIIQVSMLLLAESREVSFNIS